MENHPKEDAMVTMIRNSRGCFEIVKVEGLCLTDTPHTFTCIETAVGLMRRAGLRLWIRDPITGKMIFKKK
jgi:hypothetical protein